MTALFFFGDKNPLHFDRLHRTVFFGRLTTMEDHYRAALEREAAHQESLRRTAADRKKKFDHFESAVSELESALKRSKFHNVPAIPELKCTVSAPPRNKVPNNSFVYRRMRRAGRNAFLRGGRCAPASSTWFFQNCKRRLTSSSPRTR